jgi:nitroreductase
MKTISPEQLLTQLNWRYATKQFDPEKKIHPETWSALEESLVLTPSSFGLQPWKFFVVNDRTLRERLVAASWGQRQVADASHLVVFTIKHQLVERDIDAFVDRIVEVRKTRRESLQGYRDMMVGFIVEKQTEESRRAWASKQLYIALGNFLTSAALLGVDACPLEGLEPEQYDEILGLTSQGYTTVVAAAAGYRAAEDKYAVAPKVRFPKTAVLTAI